MDIELAVNAMEMADHLDLMVLFSGDGDFRSLVELIQRKGVRVAVVSTISTQPPMVADELRRQADEFIDLTQLMPRIGVIPASERSGPRITAGISRRSSSQSKSGFANNRTCGWRSTSVLPGTARHALALPSTGPPIV